MATRQVASAVFGSLWRLPFAESLNGALACTGVGMRHGGWPFQQLRGLSRSSTSFQEKKRKALGLDTPEALAQEQQQVAGQPVQQGPDMSTPQVVRSDAVVVRPQEGPASVEQVAQVLRHPALIVTRPIEWGTVIFGYEQANRYTVLDQHGQPVAQLAEDYTGFKNEIGRQLLRTRRSFSATVFSADGSQVIFRLRRPMYLINSNMIIEDGQGQQLGEIKQRWHPIKRNYDLYLGSRQFAAISGTFLAWEFELKDEAGRTLALIDRNFQGFGKELFTDAGKYVIHFGTEADPSRPYALDDPQPAQDSGTSPAQLTASGSTTSSASADSKHAAPVTVAAPHPPSDGPQVTPMAQARTDVAVIPTQTGNQLVVARPLALDERMAVLAAAISIDYDYFSQHSHSGGLFYPPMFMPMPIPSAPIPSDVPSDAGAAGIPPATGGAPPPGGDVAGGFGAGTASGTVDAGVGGAAQAAAPSPEMHLEGDRFDMPQGPAPGEGEMQWDLPQDVPSAGDGEAAGGLLSTLWEFVKDITE